MDGEDMHGSFKVHEGIFSPMSNNFLITPSPQSLVIKSPGTHFGLEGDPYGPYYMSNIADLDECSRAMDSHIVPNENQSAYIIPIVHPLPPFTSENPNFEIRESSNTGKTNTLARPTLFEVVSISKWAQQRGNTNVKPFSLSQNSTPSLTHPTVLSMI